MSPTTRLAEDLGVDGDNAVELMEAFNDRFGVDLNRFEFDRHFGPEAGCNPILWLWLRCFRPQRFRIESITVGDFAEAARTGKWEYRTVDHYGH